MIPFAMFDGRKIFEWNKLVYGLMATLALVFVFFPRIFSAFI